MTGNRQLRNRAVDVSRKLYVRTVAQGSGSPLPVHHSAPSAKPVENPAAFIPTPEIKVLDPVPLKHSELTLPDHYIHYHMCSGSGIITDIDHYDLLQEDIDWLHDYQLENPDFSVTENQLESLMDLYEKQAGKWTKQFDCETYFPDTVAATVAYEKLQVLESDAIAVYKYWINKRRTFDKALLRKFQEPPPFENTSPYIAFRPRERERRISHRNPRRNDWGAFTKMEVLRRDFEKVVNIYEWFLVRESHKKDLSLLDTEIFDRKLEHAFKTHLMPRKREFSEEQWTEIESLLTSPLPRSEYALDLDLSMVQRKKKRKEPEPQRRSSFVEEDSEQAMHESYAHIPFLSESLESQLQFSDSDGSDESEEDKEFFRKLRMLVQNSSEPPAKKKKLEPVSVKETENGRGEKKFGGKLRAVGHFNSIALEIEFPRMNNSNN